MGETIHKPWVVETNKFVFPTDGDSFPQIRYLGYAGIFTGLLTASTNEILGAIIVIASFMIVIMFRTHKLVLDLNSKTVTPDNLFGAKPIEFQSIERLVITSTLVAQRLNSRGSSSVINYTLFQAFLVSEGTKILLGEGRKKEKLMKHMDRISDIVSVPLHDES